MDRDLVWVLVYDSFFFAEGITQHTHTYKKEILFLSFILCHVYHRRKKDRAKSLQYRCVFHYKVITYRNYSKLSEMNGNYEV